MTLPGYCKQALEDLPVTNVKEGTNYFVISEQRWYYYDGESYVTHKLNVTNEQFEAVTNTVNVIQNNVNTIGTNFTHIQTEVNNLKSTNSDLISLVANVPNIITAMDITNPIRKIYNNVQATETLHSIPKIEFQYKLNPDRILFFITGYGNPVLISGSVIQFNNDPISIDFNPDFIGQQWINTNNKDLWIATNYSEQYHGWRKVNLDSSIINSNYSQGEGGR